MNRARKAADPAGTEKALRHVLRRLAGSCRDPAHMIELYYWSAEPELITVLRRYVALPDKPREALLAFLTMTADNPETVEVAVGPDGRITLHSWIVGDAMMRTAPLRKKAARAQPVH